MVRADDLTQSCGGSNKLPIETFIVNSYNEQLWGLMLHFCAAIYILPSKSGHWIKDESVTLGNCWSPEEIIVSHIKFYHFIHIKDMLKNENNFINLL